MLTQQFLFDAAWNGLKAQGFQKTAGWDKNGAPANKFNAAGEVCLSCANTFALRGAQEVGEIMGFIEFDLDFRCDLIDCHDKARSPSDMEARLRAFAAERKLTVPVNEKPDAFAAFMAKVQEPVAVTA